MHRFWKDTQARLIEDALTLPILLLVAVALLNVFVYGIAAMSAANAADYAARQASVAQSDAGTVAANAAWQRLNRMPMANVQFNVSVQATGQRGRLDAVVISYAVPNWFRGLAAMFGANMPPSLTGTAVSYFRHEGW